MIAARLAAPAPIAARLLAGDLAFLAEHDRHASLREEKRDARADDAAADDDDIRLRRKFGGRKHWIDAWWHQLPSARYSAAASPIMARARALGSLAIRHERHDPPAKFLVAIIAFQGFSGDWLTIGKQS